MDTVKRAVKFATRTARMRASTIREMLKITQQPDVISFAGGLPAPELFPTEEIGQCTVEVMREVGSQALQYGVTDGIPELREWVAQRLTEHVAPYDASDIMIVNGSQQGLDLIAKILIDPGDHIVLERPSYLGAIQAFDAYQARYITAETDEDGMVPESLDHVLSHTEPLPKFVYLIPNFQNPTGRTLARERRERIVQICAHYGVPIVEDDPYGELRFAGHRQRSLASYGNGDATIIHSGTGSKILAPGLRIAWLATHDKAVHEKLVLAKQGADLQSGSLAQYVFHRVVSRKEAFERHVATIVRVYGERRDVMYQALKEFMPSNVEFNHPEGGMFLWARVRGVDTTELLKISAQQKVAFVPGVSFYPQRDVTDGMRLNFSHSSAEKIRTGIERLARSIRSMS